MNTRRIAPTYSIRNDRDKIQTAIALGTPFYTKSATLTGFRHLTGTGELPRKVADMLRENRDVFDYFVYSYDTPIAWHRGPADRKEWNQYKGGLVTKWHPGFWTLPDIKYGPDGTMTFHQNLVREALVLESRIQDVPEDWK